MIPKAWDIERAETSYEDGLLTIKVPYSEEQKRIEQKKVLWNKKSIDTERDQVEETEE
jgi:hypothetical protein